MKSYMILFPTHEFRTCGKKSRKCHWPGFLTLLVLILFILGSTSAFGATTTSFCNFSTSKQNLWSSDPQVTEVTFDHTLSEVAPRYDSEDDLKFNIPIQGPGQVYNFGVDLHGETDSKMGLYSTFKYKGGEVDILYGGAVKFNYPDPRTFKKGTPFTVNTSLEHIKKKITTRNIKATADMYLAAYTSLTSHLKTTTGGREETVFDFAFDTRALANAADPHYTINGQNGFASFTLMSADSVSDQLKFLNPVKAVIENCVLGNDITSLDQLYSKWPLPLYTPWIFENTYNVSGMADIPHIETNADFKASDTNPSLLKHVVEKEFLSLDLDLTGFIPLPKYYKPVIGASVGTDWPGGKFRLSYDILSFKQKLGMTAVQTYEFAPTVAVTLGFSSPIDFCVTTSYITNPPSSDSGCWRRGISSMTMGIGYNLHLIVPTGGPDSVTVSSSYALSGKQFRNKSDLKEFYPAVFSFLQADAFMSPIIIIPKICTPSITQDFCAFGICKTWTIVAAQCTPGIKFDGFDKTLGPAYETEMNSLFSTPEQVNVLNIWDRTWDLPGFAPTVTTSSLFTMQAGNPPTVTDATLVVTEDTSKLSTFSATAIIENRQTFRVISQGQKGMVTIINPANNSYTYTPNPNAYGSDTFTFKVHDNNPLINADSNLGIITVNIANVNDAPADLLLSKDNVAEASAAGNVVGSLTPVDPDLPDHDTHTFTLTDSAGGRFKLVGNQLQVANGSLLNYSSATQHTVSIRVTDASGATFTKSFVIRVKTVPVASNGTLPVTEDFVKNGTLVAVDRDGETPIYSILTNPAKGAVVITNATTGAYTYTPLPNAIGTDTFSFRTTDTSGYQSNSATITVTIESVNDPVADILIKSAIAGDVAFDELLPKDTSGFPFLNSMASSGDYSIVCFDQNLNGGVLGPVIRKKISDGSYVAQIVEPPVGGWQRSSNPGTCAISGNYASLAAGAKAYILKRNASDGVWRVDKILSSSTVAGYNSSLRQDFGNSMALDGDTLAYVNTAQNGIFFTQRDNGTGTWQDAFQYIAPDRYGSTLALSGNRAAVGSKRDNTVHIIEKDGSGIWQRTATLQSPQGYDEFGTAVAVSGDTVVVGAPNGIDNERGKRSGVAYVYIRENAGSWKSTVIHPEDGEDADYFGYAVSVTKASIAVGAPRKDVIGRMDAGAVYLFTRNSLDQFYQTRQVLLPKTSNLIYKSFVFQVIGTYLGSQVHLEENSDDLLSNYRYIYDGWTGNYFQYLRTDISALSVNEGSGHGATNEGVLGGSVAGTLVGTIVPADPDLDSPDLLGTYTFTLLDSAGGRFKIVGNELQVDNASLLDFETAKLHVIRVKVADSHGSSLEKSFRVYVNNLNELPKGDDKTFTTLEDTPLTGTLTGRDSNGSTVTFKIATPPAKGAVTLNAASGVFTYTPFANLNGDDTFTFYANDGLHNSSAATVTMHIMPVRDPSTGIAVYGASRTLNDPAGAAGDLYGYSVALSGDYALVGASGNSENASASGAAYFMKKDVDGLWQQTDKVKPGNQINQFAGTAVAISDAYGIVGAYGHDRSGAAASGIAYIYKRNNDTWSYEAAMDPTESQASDYTGTSVGISGSYAIAGAPGASGNGKKSGAAYVMERGAGSWNTPVRLLPADGADNDFFGSVTALSGSYAIVGAPGDADKGPYSGSSYIFERNATSGLWEQKGKLLASDGSVGDFFGLSVAISGNDAVVGAPYRTNKGVAKAGAAYVFKRGSNGTWAEVARLQAVDATPECEFGTSVSLSGDLIAVGARKDGAKGSVVIFRRAADGTWSQAQKLTAADGATGDDFGTAVSLSGITMFVGAPLADLTAKADAGKAYVVGVGGPSVAENSPVDTEVGSVSILSPDSGETFSYTLLNDADGRFKLSGNRILVANSALLDYEASASHDIRVRGTDSGGNSFEAIITIIVINVYELPVARDNSLFVIKDIASAFTLTATADKNLVITYSTVSNGSNGTVQLLDPATGAIRYTPNAGFTGTDSFTFRASDGISTSIAATIAIVITPDFSSGLMVSYPISGNADDASGNGHNALARGPYLTENRLGNANSAYRFAKNHVYLEIPKLIPLGGAFSFSAWVRNDDINSRDALLMDFRGVGIGEKIQIGVNPDNKIYVSLPGAAKVLSSSSLEISTWTHLAVAVDGSGLVNIYINGASAGSVETRAPQAIVPSTQTFGCDRSSGGQQFWGAMDEIRLYNRALQSSEIQTVAGAPSCGTAHKGNFTVAPTTSLCTESVASAVKGTGPWNWYCTGTSSSTACRADKKITGVCSAFNGMSLDSAPTSLCESGIPSAVAGNGPWSWTCNGANTGTTASCSANINFYPLTVVKTGSGSGLVAANTGTVNWSGKTGTATYSAAAEVTLTATPGNGFWFTGWSGACTGTGSCSVTMSAAKSVTAHFVDANAGLMAYYPFSGTADDASGNGRNGTVAGATLTGDVSGVPGAAYGFDGSGNYISLPAFPVGGEFSVSAWVYLNNNGINWQRLLDFGNGPGNNNLIVGWTGQKMFVEAYNGSSTKKVYSTETFPQGEWVHVVAAIDAAGNATLYRNGVLKGEGNTNVPPLMSRTYQFIGKSNWPDPTLGGKIDEVRLYNRALDAIDAQALYQINGRCGSSTGANLTTTPTVGLCTEGTGSAVTGSGPWDWSCAGNHGGGSARCSANLIVNGACGTANLQTLPTLADAELCSAGTASTVTGSGPWSWSCQGLNSGAGAGCTAEIQTYSVTVTRTGTGSGTISDNTGGLITWNGAIGTGTFKHGTTLLFTAVPELGSIVRSWAGTPNESETFSLVVDSAKNIAVEFDTVTIADGLLLNWPFTGNANDASTNGYNGDVKGPALAADRFGAANNAYDFAGGWWSNITVSPTATFPDVNSLSVSLWFRAVNAGAYPNNTFLISKGGVVYTDFTSPPQFAIGLPGAGSYDIWGGGRKLRVNGTGANNEWTHLVVVYSGTTATVYENGINIGQGETGAVHDLSRLFTTIPDFFVGIGGQAGGWEVTPRLNSFQGTIDDIRLYKRALNSTEVEQLRLLDANTLTITKSATGSGTVTSNTGTIKWNGATGKANYGIINNTVVTLTAVADTGSVFTGWSGACSGVGTCTVTMDTSRNVTATFMTPADGLIAHYPFNSNANDASSNAYNGTINGATPTTDRFGNADSAYSFDGVGNYISLPQIPIGGAFSASVWVNLVDNSADWTRIFDFGSGSPDNNLIMGLLGKKMFLDSYIGTSNIRIFTTEDFPQGEWIQVTGTIDASGNARIYWNGVLKASGTIPVPPMVARTNQYVGRSNWVNPYFKGKMDDLRIYNRAVSGQEAYALSTHTLTATKSGSGSGTVTSNKGALQWTGLTGTATLLSGEVVTLAATPDGSATFTGWTGACSGTGSCIVTMDGAKNVGAIFTHDTTPPTGTITISSAAASTNAHTVSLTLTCTDTDTGCAQMTFSNDNQIWTSPESYSSTKNWYLSSAKSLPLVISDFQPNFQTKLTVMYNPFMRTDFGDLRFIDTTTSQNIPYWFESINNGVSATVWIKTGSNSTITMKYGTPASTSASNGNDVFDLWDDFVAETRTSPDANKWQLENFYNGTVEIVPGYVSNFGIPVLATHANNYSVYGTTTSDDDTAYMISKAQMPANYVVETLVLEIAPASYTRFFAVRSSTGTKNKTFYMAKDNVNRLTGGYRDSDGASTGWFGSGIGPVLPSGSQIAKIIVNGDTVSSYYGGLTVNTRTVSGWDLRRVVLMHAGANTSTINVGKYNYYDWVRVRKYAAVEPTVTFGSEQIEPPYDGVQSAYVKYQDAAGNWSNVYSDSIQLETAKPTVTVNPAGGIYKFTQNVTLTCNDGNGTGCDGIFYTTDGSTPTTGSTPYSDPITISSRTVLKFIAKDHAGNNSAVRTEVYSFNLMGGAVQKNVLNVEPSVVTTLVTSLPAGFDNTMHITTDGESLYLTEYARILKMSIATGQVSVIAGVTSGYQTGSNDGIGEAARFNDLKGITSDGTNLYVADKTNDLIRKIVIATGEVTTLAGQVNANVSTDGVGAGASFREPYAITNDGTYLYVIDTWDNVIRKIEIASGTVTTIAGVQGVHGSSDGIGTSASFDLPTALTTDGTNLYVADYHTIRKINLATRQVTTLAGAGGQSGTIDGVGSAARFQNIDSIITDGTNLYVSDMSHYVIRKVEIATGNVLTIAGLRGASGLVDGTGADARFNYPNGITTDGTNLYVVDNNNTIRKISAGPDTRGSGLIAHYPFNGNGNDAGGSGYNGTINGATLTTDRFGNADSAYSFDGVNNYISLPSFTVGGAFSASVWVNLVDNSADWTRIFDFGFGEYDNNLIMGVLGKKMFLDSYNGATSLRIFTADDFPQGEWVQVTGTIDASGNAGIYWNGVLKASGTIPVPLMVARTNQYVGKSNWDNPYFNGKMDDLRLYNRALTQADIQALYTYESGSCGSANTQTFATAPTTSLCSTGRASTVAVVGGSLVWTCNGVNGGVTTQCGANVSVNGSCGVAAGQAFNTRPPDADLCQYGEASAVSGSGPWQWSCNGYFGGTSFDCSANLKTYPLTVNKVGSGSSSGSVTVDSGTMNWSSSTGTATYNFGDTVTLSASPTVAGTYFTSWAGACSGSGSCTVAIDAAKSVTARFTDLSSGLLAYYPFHGDANDASGNGRHATVNGATVITNPYDNFIQSYQFSPMTFMPYNYANYITVPSFEIGGAFSMSAWVSADTWADRWDWQRIIDFGNGQPADNIVVTVSGGKLHARLNNGTNEPAIIISAIRFPDGIRTHVAFTVDSSGFMKLYMDGQLQASGQGVAPRLLTRTNQYVGKSNWSTDPYLHGLVDELRLYGRALSDTDVADLAARRDAICGNAHAKRFSARPDTDLCAVGTASAISGAGPWSWTCAGITTGNDSSCSAEHAFTQTITFNPVTMAFGTPTIDLSSYASGGASGNPVTFTLVSGPGSLSGINNAILAILGPGDIVVRASQAGNADYFDAAVQQTITVTKGAATVTPGNLSQAFDGSAKPVTVATIPANRTVNVTYDGSTTVPASIGSYAVVATINDPNYQGTASGTLVIGKGVVAITLDVLSAIYDGTPKVATALTDPAGKSVSITYNGSTTAPTDAGSYTVVATIVDSFYQGTASGTLTIGKRPVDIALGSLSQTYDGSARGATATTSPAGKTVSFTYDGSATVPVNAGSYAVVATANDDNYQGTVNGTLTIAKATATLTLGGLSATYDGTEKPVIYTVSPAGKTVVVTYNNSPAVPVDAGYYFVSAYLDDANYAGSANGTLIIAKAAATVSLGSMNFTYDGSVKPVTATTTPLGFPVTVTYSGSATAPATAGSYAVIATINDTNYSGTASGTLVIAKAAASVTFGNLTVPFDGSPKTPATTTTPAGLAVNFTYNGLSSAPADVGSHAVVATINDANYQGTASGTFIISDQIKPVIYSFTALPRAGYLIADTTIVAGGDVAVSGYCLTEGSDSSGCSWSATAPTSYTFATAGFKTLYAYVIAANGNVSLPHGSTLTVSIPTLTVTVTGAGSGTVTSVPAGIACTAGSCAKSFTGTGPVDLHATPSALSLFSGWSGGVCSGKNLLCSVAMSGDKSVIATFAAAALLHIDGTSYASLQAAYDAASEGAIIQLLENTATGALTANRNVTVKLKGGYNSGYSATPGKTNVTAPLRIRSGKVVADKVTVR